MRVEFKKEIELNSDEVEEVLEQLDIEYVVNYYGVGLILESLTKQQMNDVKFEMQRYYEMVNESDLQEAKDRIEELEEEIKELKGEHISGEI